MSLDGKILTESEQDIAWNMLFDIQSLHFLQQGLGINYTPQIIRSSYMTGTDIVEFYNIAYENKLASDKKRVRKYETIPSNR